MEKDMYEYVAKRCENALLESEKYASLEQSGISDDEKQEVDEIIIYEKGFSDAVKMILRCLL